MCAFLVRLPCAGFEITHNSMLLTIFSASNYGGVCRNRGGVLIFDEKGPAEV